MISETPITLDTAADLFEAMSQDDRDRVARTFDIMWASGTFRDWRVAFAQAVENEIDAPQKVTL